jgi:adenine-specific DNA-methyltransferase
LHESTGQIPNDFWDTNFGSNQEASLSLEKIFEQRIFDFPKSTKLLVNICTIGSNKDSYVLDFFAGSGTTAHAVMKLNAEDGGNRKCISVQLPEPTDEKSEAFKAGYTTIAEITKERIRRAGEKIKKENEGAAIDKLDIGFKAFKLDSSNINAWDGNPDNLETQLDVFANNIKTNRTEEDILFEILLKYGLDLTVPIEEKNIAGKMVYNVGIGTLFICLADGITPQVSEGIGAWKQEQNPTICRAIFKDSGFASDKDKVNAMQILKRFGIEEVNSI